MQKQRQPLSVFAFLGALLLASGTATAEVPLRMAIQDLIETHGDGYPAGAAYLQRLDAIVAADDAQTFEALRAEALLANPLLNFDTLLLVSRRADSPALGLPQNWQGNCSLNGRDYDDAILALSPVRPHGTLSTVCRPEPGAFVGDVDLHFDARRLLFSSVNAEGRWRVYEIGVDGTGLREIPQPDEPGVDNYDACYLPNGDLIYGSTATVTGVPCVRGDSRVANLFLWSRADNSIRRLTFDQDHNWCPTLLPNGRVLYLRWEYSDIPHFVSRILFHMNPDGTAQMEYYGSNSYWPNAMFYARPIPEKPGQFAAVVGGHHGVRRMGELVLFDVNLGRHEADGAVQRIPGHGQPVEAVLYDELVDDSWPKYLHPWPLSDKHFLVSMQPDGDSLWGIYLVDVFDNRVLIKELPGLALLEPVPLRKTPRPPIVPPRVDLRQQDALVYMANVYAGPGLDGIPRGAVKQLRVYTYHFAFHGVGGQYNRVGLDGPWDIRQVIGTVPVEDDGSAYFRVPANMPLGVQPLDAEGKALQLMRSWMTAMPGEILSCVGCHEQQSSTVPNLQTFASRRQPSIITPFYGPTRGFSFTREVQPVLDSQCIGCHDGAHAEPDLRHADEVNVEVPDKGYTRDMAFSPAYLALRKYIRGHTIESDMHVLTPMEFHADTTRLVQLLESGHQDVSLDAESWDRMITWIDMNTPYHGTWAEAPGLKGADMAEQRERRREMLERYAQRTDDAEKIFNPYTPPVHVPALEPPLSPEQNEIRIADWSPESEAVPPRQAEAVRAVDLGNGVRLELVRIPAMRTPPSVPRKSENAEAFWMGRYEVTNAQFAQYDPDHDSRLESGDFLQFSVAERGWLVNAPEQPVCRVSWNEAMAFCEWLSRETGLAFSLPTDTQWEYACRAASDTPMHFGTPEADFTPWANLADASLADIELANLDNKHPYLALPKWRPAIMELNDGHRVSAPVGTYRPNAWGLHDMHGNVAEWTATLHQGRNVTEDEGKRVVRGGSWYSLPKEATASHRLAYRPYQRVFDVGFRVVCVDTHLATR